ncbi:SAV_2336 N-terminal domain-related protein [Streptomyces sp. NPDC046465]|uniref:SAV_2336 N-terminal domain-related protein n=1 Tax=Streptomyces sp. NPDC046465 TaxID=3155810 RepID=UPI0033F7886C
MNSDAPRRRGPLARLSDVLAQAADGAPPTPVELAELLWLAAQQDAPAKTASAPGDVPPSPDAPSTSTSTSTAPSATPPHPAPSDDRVPLHLPAPMADGGAPDAPGHTGAPSALDAPGTPPQPPEQAQHTTSLRVPVPPMVTHPLALQRALRPLKRRVPSPVGHVIDEAATAHRIARIGGHPWGWLPVLRPAEERWLRLSLVCDAGPTMPIWHPLVHELHTALAQSGIFRTVELHRAAPDGTVPPRAAAAPATGRTVTLLVSDCMGPQWRPGAAGARWYRTLRRWAARMPLAVIQPLPERLWRTTALPTTPGSLAAPHPAAPSGALTFTPYTSEPSPPGALPVPVLEPAPSWLAHWASLVADGSGVELPASVGWLGREPTATRTLPGEEAPAEDVTRLAPEDLVLRFRSTASPEAFRLAGHLAVGEPRLPVMRLVQAAVEERPRPQHLAEVILSGMLTEGPSAAPGSYVFRDGVREVLLRTLPRTARGRTRELLARMGELIDDRAGVTPGELRAVASVPSSRQGAGTGTQGPAREPFATVTPDTVRQLGAPGLIPRVDVPDLAQRAEEPGRGPLIGGRYRGVGQIGLSGRVWRAEDLHETAHENRHENPHQNPHGANRTVVVQRFLRAPRWLRLDFVHAARRLSRFRHPNVAAVHDYGFHRRVPYLAMEFIEGQSLEELLTDHPWGLPTDLLMELVPRLADAVTALHAEGMVHGALTHANVRVSPRGPVLCGFTLTPFGEVSRTAELRALGRLVRKMYEPTEGASFDAPWLPEGRRRTRPGATRAPHAYTLSEQAADTLTSALRDLRSRDADVLRRGIGRLGQLASPSIHERTYSLLGPLSVTQARRPLPVGEPRGRAMLCMLLLRQGRAMTATELAAGIWGSAPPANAPHLLALSAARLRETLGPDSVVTAGDGYALMLTSDVDDVDLFQCRRLAAEAEAYRRDGDIDAALDRVAAALSLWDGDVLEDIPGPAAEETRATIRALRQSLLHLQWELTKEQEGTEGAEQDPAELDELLTELSMVEEADRLAPHERFPGARPDSLDAATTSATGEPSPPSTTVSFEYLARPAESPEATLQRLGRAVSHLLVAGGIGPDRFEMRPRPRGWDVTIAPEVHVLHVLLTTVDGLPDALDGFPVLGLGVTVTHDADPTVSAPSFPSGLGHLFDRTGTRAVVIVSSDLHDRLYESGRAGAHLFEPVPQSDDWYCDVTARPPRALPPGPGDLPRPVDSLILGFDGTLAHLYPGRTARDAARSLAALIAELRDPEAAEAGDPLLPAGATASLADDRIHPLDILRAFAQHPTLPPELHARLEAIELRAAATAKPPGPAGLLSDALRALARPGGLRLAVATDVSPRAVTSYLAAQGFPLPEAAVHGRTPDLTLLMPDPDCLRRAIDQLGSSADRCVMVGSSTAEAAAAQSLGIPFIGLAADGGARRRLIDAGARFTRRLLGDVTVALRER